MEILYIVGIILILVGSGWFFYVLYHAEPQTTSTFGKELKETTSPFITLLIPFRPFNKIIARTLGREVELERKFYLARWRIKPEDFITIKELCAVFLPLFFFLLGLKNKNVLIFLAIMGFIYPDLLLASKVKRRRYAIVRMLPETIDLLSLCVGGGLDFMAAVRWVVDKVKINPMIEELTVVLKEINVGKPRVEALRDMARRLNIPDVTSFVRILIQADRMGTPVEEAFKILSEDSRMRRFHRGERQAMTAPIKMLLPLIFFIMPVIMIIVAGPILVRFVTEGIFTGGGTTSLGR